MALQFWLYLGIILIGLEFILPGLVSIFIGLGALTVAVLAYLDFKLSLLMQLITFFLSSIIYIFSLRLLVIRFYPTDSEKQLIDEDEIAVGTIVTALNDFQEGAGRVSYAGTSWSARSLGNTIIGRGDQVKIVKRDNITYLVEKPLEEIKC